MTFRYAIYFVPEAQKPLARLGSALLGRDSESGREIAQAVLPGFAGERLHSLTTDARRYGLHATVKAPFFLNPGQTESGLLDSAACFILGRKPITLPRLEIVRIGSFFALVPARETVEERQAVESLNSFAAEAVSFFDPFRAEPSEAETARRAPHKLSARQRELLTAWGYPYVFDEYRFHITLTDKISDPDEASAMESALHGYFQSLRSSPVQINGICVCRQDIDKPEVPAASSAAAAFTLLQRFSINI